MPSVRVKRGYTPLQDPARDASAQDTPGASRAFLCVYRLGDIFTMLVLMPGTIRGAL
ncbi:hypothetical protein EVJ58_g6431 [Rhodofomes roseus]|uniref:Uncharacterized protein n=1 Tax=Rhodofomes roseus TaxID=34475 RepID=A0A4Y9YAC8_9APHY|nr:hypothetical protein EVJ58_g6431 [Rhodofomes roseus]